MKVTFLAGTLGRGGAERQLLLMLTALQNCGIDARVLSLTKGEDFESEILSMGVPVQYVGAGNRARRTAEITRSVSKNRCDVLQSSHFFANLYTGVCGRILGIPSIGAVRNDFESEVNAHGWLGYWQVNLPNYLIANSMLAYNRAVRSGVLPNKIEFLRNVVTPNGRGGREDSSELNILFVGRLHEDKSPHRFLIMANSLLRKFPERSLKFKMAGDGPLRLDLEQLRKELGIPSANFEFLGCVTDMDKLYGEADILVSTSRREGTPNVVLEAMANGVAVVAMRAGDIPELVGRDRGVLVEQDDQSGLESEVSKLILDTELRHRLSRTSKRYAEQNHSIKYLERRLPEIYQNILRHDR